MVIEDSSFPFVSCVLLFFAMFSYWFSVFFPTNQLSFRVSSLLVCFSTFFFTLTLCYRWLKEGYFPLSNLYESLIFLCWGISTVHLVVEYQTKSRVSGALSTPLLFFLSGFATLTLPVDMQKALPLVPSLQSNWLMMHVSMMMVSYATLIVGSLFSLFYLFFFSFLSKNTFSGAGAGATDVFSFSFSSNQKLSFLQTIDIWSYRIIGVGFPFLTIGIISGAVWANEAWGSYWSWDPKETWAFITWLVFASYLHSRLIKGWEGHKASILGSCGFFVIWICYLGVNFLGKGLHTYGWVL